VLVELGWDDAWAALATRRAAAGTPARVVRADPGRAVVLTAGGPRTAAVPPGIALVSGDWVVLHAGSGAGSGVAGGAGAGGSRPTAAAGSDPDRAGTVAAVLPRRTELVRGAGRRAAAAQVLAANIDVVLVVVSLDAAPSRARLERMLAVAWDSGAQPVVVLTKADLTPTAESERDEVAEVALAAPVVLASTVDGRGLDELRGHLRPGRTAVLLGVSGAGKSTLLNALAGHELAPTAEVGRTGRGRHTTTARELVVLPGLGVLLDTPGLRGVQLWESDEGLGRAFADIVELAGGCRFRDCRHAGEPGCAVAAAVEAGTLSSRRVASHAKLEREVGWLRDRYDARLRAQQRRRWREIARATRSSPRRG
jgi:ribosome biogenesis GTPase